MDLSSSAVPFMENSDKNVVHAEKLLVQNFSVWVTCNQSAQVLLSQLDTQILKLIIKH
jgi:hypothetical protein